MGVWAGGRFCCWLKDCRFTLQLSKFLVLILYTGRIAVLPGNGDDIPTFLKEVSNRGVSVFHACYLILYGFGLVYFCVVRRFPPRCFPSLYVDGYNMPYTKQGGC